MADNIVSTLTIKIIGEQNSYRIEASTPFAKTGSLSFDLSLTDEELHTLSLLEDEFEDVSEQTIISIGQSLYKSVFAPEILFLYDKVKRKAGNNNVRIRLIVSSPDLNKFPWEIMHDGNDFISLYSQHPLVRGLKDVFQVRSAPVNGPVKVLYIWAEPKDKPEIHASVGGNSIKKMLAENKLIKVDILPNASLIQLRRALLSEYHVVCFAGHGDENGLAFEKFNTSEIVTAKEFAREIEGRQVKLVFLAACKTGSSSRDDLAGFAHVLAEQTHVPSIVAMQYEIGDDQANLLTTRFFELIANFRSVDVALADARKALLKERKILRDVFAPVLYLQGQTSNLFRRTRNWIAISLGVFSSILLVTLFIFFMYNESSRQKLINSKSIEIANQAMQAYADGYPDLALALALNANQIENPPGHSQQSLYQVAYSPGTIEIISADRGIFTPTDNEVLLLRGTQLIKRNVLTNEESIFFDSSYQILDFDIDLDGSHVATLFENGQVAVIEIPISDDEIDYFSFSDKYYEFAGELVDPVFGLPYSITDIIQDNIDDILVFDPISEGIIVAFTDKFVYGDIDSMKSTCEISTNGINIVDTSWIDQNKVLLGLENGGMITVDPISCSTSEIFFWNNLYDGKANTHEGLIDVSGVNIRVDSAGSVTYYIGLPVFPTAFHALNENYVLMLDSESKEVIRRLDGEMYGVDGLAISRQGEIVLAGDPNSLIAWDLETLEQIYKFNLPYHLITHITLSGDGSKALVSDTDGVTRLLALNSNLMKAQYDFGDDGTGTIITASQLLPDGKSILIGGMSSIRSDPRTIHIYLEDGSRINTFEWHEGITGLEILADGKTALEASESGLWLLNIEEPSKSRQILDYPITSLAISPDKKRVAINSSSQIVLLDSISFERFATIDSITDSITSLAFSQSGKTLAIGVENSEILIWDVESNKEILSLSGSSDSINKVLYLSEDKVASVDDRFIRIWDLSSGRQILLLDGFLLNVSDIELSPSGKTLISGSGDGTILLWDIESGEIIYSFEVDRPINSISIYPETKLVIGSGDGVIQVWDIHFSLDALKDWISDNRYIYELTCDERVKYSIEPLCD